MSWRKIKEILKIAFTTTSAHDIGVMYIVLGLVGFLVGSGYAGVVEGSYFYKLM